MPDLLRPRGLAAAQQHSLLRRMQAEMIYHRDKVGDTMKMNTMITNCLTTLTILHQAFDYLVYAIRVLPGQLVKTALDEQRR